MYLEAQRLPVPSGLRYGLSIRVRQYSGFCLPQHPPGSPPTRKLPDNFEFVSAPACYKPVKVHASCLEVAAEVITAQGRSRL